MRWQVPWHGAKDAVFRSNLLWSTWVLTNQHDFSCPYWPNGSSFLGSLATPHYSAVAVGLQPAYFDLYLSRHQKVW